MQVKLSNGLYDLPLIQTALVYISKFACSKPYFCRPVTFRIFFFFYNKAYNMRLDVCISSTCTIPQTEQTVYFLLFTL